MYPVGVASHNHRTVYLTAVSSERKSKSKKKISRCEVVRFSTVLATGNYLFD
jgi:hypothetical protein